MDIQEFERQIRIGDRVKIQSMHSGGRKIETSQPFIFMGYEPCTRCKTWRDCPGYIHLQKENDISVEEKTCYRNHKQNNIRLVILTEQNNLPEDLFEI